MNRQLVQAKMDTLRLLIDERNKQYVARFDAMQTATDLAATSLSKRLEGMNEIRAQLGAQRAEFATNDKFDAWATATASRLETLMKQNEQTVGGLRDAFQRDVQALRDRMDRDQKTVNDDIRSLRESRAGQSGGSTSLQALFGYMTGVGGFLIAVVLLILRLTGH